MNDNKKYLINFLFIFIILYIFFHNSESYLALFLGYIVFILGYTVDTTTIIMGQNTFIITPSCTASLEISLFLAYVLATPKVSANLKIGYGIFGLVIITVANVIRIILIINYATNVNYWTMHDVISFILFPIALLLNWAWTLLLKNKKIIQ